MRQTARRNRPCGRAGDVAGPPWRGLTGRSPGRHATAPAARPDGLFLCCAVCLILAICVGQAGAAEISGNADLGAWFIANNVSGDPKVLVNDSYGQNYIQDRYDLAMLDLRLNAKDLTDGKTSYKLNVHFDGRSLIKIENDNYTLGTPDRARYQLNSLNVQAENVADSFDLWLGRQLILEAGNVLFDGFRGVYKANEHLDVSLYGGLGADPRTLTGYIGPSYQKNPLNPDFQTGGVYASYRRDPYRLDGAVRGDFYKGKLDRATLFSQGSVQLSPYWSISAMVEGDIGGKPGLRNGSLYVINRPAVGVTNTLSASYFTALQYAESNVSGIPVPSGILTAPVGDLAVNTSSYASVREHVMIRLFERNYVFGAVQFARRSFDDAHQIKYTLGFRDPRLFDTSTDLRVQADLIDNFRGFSTVLDALIGRGFQDEVYRLEAGGSFYANERDDFLNLKLNTLNSRQTDKEFALRANGYYSPNRKISWILNYAFYRDVDATNLNQNVNLHEVLLMTSVRF